MNNNNNNNIMNNKYNIIHNYWLNKSHSNIIYNKINTIPPRHFYSLVQKSHSNYNLICKNLQKDAFC